MVYNIKLHRETSGDKFGLALDDIRYDDPVATCDNCGRQGIQSDYLNLVVVTGSLGHHSLFRLKQKAPEQWACSLDCWMSLYVETGTNLIRELVEINAEEERSDHNARARELAAAGKDLARSRIEPGEFGLLAEHGEHDNAAQVNH